MTATIARVPPGRHPERESANPGQGAAMRPMKRREPGTVKATVLDGFAQAGGIDRVMTITGLGKTRAYAMTDEGEADAHLQYRQAAALSAAGVPTFAEHLSLLAGGVFLPLPADHGALGALTADAAQDFGTLMAHQVVALADGRVTADEAREALPKLAEVMQALAALHSAMQAIADGSARG